MICFFELLNRVRRTRARRMRRCLAQKPKIAPYIGLMRERLAETLGIPVDAVSVKATTTEHLGFVGREEGVAAYATCLLRRMDSQGV